MMPFRHRRGVLEMRTRPVLMGILNVTPDSFSDGGQHVDPDQALARALEMIGEGADIIDIGGESTRPGSQPVSPDEECARVIPVIERIVNERPDVLISIDTSKALVARQALHAGAVIINDVSGGLWDPEIVHVAHQFEAGYICMHSLDRPETMQDDPTYSNVIAEILDFLKARQEFLLEAGLPPDALCFDVGIGFGKKLEHNLALIRAGATSAFDTLGRPLLWGLSRKSFIDHLLHRPVDERLPAGLAAHAALLESQTPQIWRIHDVRETTDYLAMHQALHP